jgi:hypothetical protein
VQNVVRPFRELFVMLFFVSMGTLVDVSSVGSNWRAIAIIAIAAIAVRFLLWAGVGRLVSLDGKSAAALGIALLPMGEFNIVLGNASFAAGRLDRTEVALLLGTSMIAILASALAARIGEKALSRGPCIRPPAKRPLRSAPVVVIGYGRVGQTACSMLAQHNVDVIVIEHDPALVRRAEASGLEALYGDGGDPHVLENVISPQTRVVLTTVPDAAANAAIVRWLQAHGQAAIVARAPHSSDVMPLLGAGAAVALVPEIEGARAFAQAVLALVVQ